MSVSNQRNIGSRIKAVKGINPEDTDGTEIEGPAIDRTGFLSGVLHQVCGAATGTPTTQLVDAKIQESADGSTGWTDALDADGNVIAAAQLAADDTESEKDFDLSGLLNFIRVVQDATFTGGSSPTIPVASTVVLGGHHQSPQ